MIHIEGDWYIRVEGYKNYVLGRKYVYTLMNGKKVERLADATYHPDLVQALRAYTELYVGNLLKDEEIELVDALRKAREAYERYTELVKQSLSASE